MAPTTSSVADALRTTLDLFDTGLDLMRQNLRGVTRSRATRTSSDCLTTGFWIGQERNLVTVQAGPST
jgi:hypothetical protein